MSWHDPAVIASSSARLSGLEVVQALVDGRVPPPPIAVLMNMRLREAQHGLAIFECTPAEEFYNTIGAVHGGLMCTLADSAAGCAVHTTLAAGTGYTSVDITVNYLRPVTLASGTLVATGRVVKSGRRMSLATAEIHDGSGRLVTTASSNCLIIPGS
jgi:uncharacterized protein (TIGR00369 family)